MILEIYRIDFHNIKYTSSLYFHFLYDIDFCCSGISHDLSCIMKYREADIVLFNAVNAAYNNKYEFSIQCLLRTVEDNHEELFRIVLMQMLKDGFYKYDYIKNSLKNNKHYYELCETIYETM